MQQAMAADGIDIALGSGPAHGVHRQGLADQGRRRAGRARRSCWRWWCGRTGRQDRGRAQGQDGQRLDRRLADLLAGQRDLAPAGLGPERHQHRPDRAPARRRSRRSSAAIIDGVDHRHRHRLRPREAGRGAHPACASATGEGLPRPRDLRHRQGDREQARKALRGLPRGLVRDASRFMRENKAETVDDRDAGHGQGSKAIVEPRLRRADADVLRRRTVRPEGAGRAGQVLRRHRSCCRGSRT